MSPFEMEQIIKRICEKNNIDCKVKIQYSHHLARYNNKDNVIYFNPDRCITMANKMNMSIEGFISFTTYHEIGHCLDHLKGNQSDSRIEREVAAWELSRRLIPENVINEYDEFNHVNVESYKKRGYK
jgi:hypothetical protein